MLVGGKVIGLFSGNARCHAPAISQKPSVARGFLRSRQMFHVNHQGGDGHRAQRTLCLAAGLAAVGLHQLHVCFTTFSSRRWRCWSSWCWPWWCRRWPGFALGRPWLRHGSFAVTIGVSVKVAGQGFHQAGQVAIVRLAGDFGHLICRQAFVLLAAAMVAVMALPGPVAARSASCWPVHWRYRCCWRWCRSKTAAGRASPSGWCCWVGSAQVKAVAIWWR